VLSSVKLMLADIPIKVEMKVTADVAHVVFESLVRSGYLALVVLTETKTG